MNDFPINHHQTMKPNSQSSPNHQGKAEEEEVEGVEVHTNQTMNTQQQPSVTKRLCDYCNQSTALLYCRADSAKLCFSCDREVHGTNQLFTKHSRSQLCDSCDESPASIFCETEQTVLCQNCDWESHSSLSPSSVHNRRPVEGFIGCPSVNEFVTIMGFDDIGNKCLLSIEEKADDDGGGGFLESGFEGFSDYFVWETPSVVSLDDLVSPGSLDHNFKATDVPSIPKNRNAVCGKRKEDVLSQLRELAKSECGGEDADADTGHPVSGLHLLPPHEQDMLYQGNMYTGCEYEVDRNSFRSCEASGLQWFGDCGEAEDQDFYPSSLIRRSGDESITVPNKCINVIDGEVNGHESQLVHQPEDAGKTPVEFPKMMGQHELNSQERDSALTRYKEKKKTRRYEKQIRYESRKVRAESRIRIKGRFAKMDH